MRLAWSEPDELYRIDPGGPVKVSADGGETWEDRGDTGGEPQALTVDDEGVLFAATLDGKVQRSEDGGKTWRRSSPRERRAAGGRPRGARHAVDIAGHAAAVRA